jgi:hypothetical protein
VQILDFWHRQGLSFFPDRGAGGQAATTGGPKRAAVTMRLLLVTPIIAVAQDRQAPDAPPPIAMGDSLWAEELNFMEVRDKVLAGTTTIIVRTGSVVKFVPDGSIEPRDGHMRYAGTISLEAATFEALLTDIGQRLEPAVGAGAKIGSGARSSVG